jgi:prepilin-type N-terminal cleavage/methylation domain-containing protein
MSRPRRQGFTVFEVMIALSIFSLVVVGLATCLNELMDASIQSRREDEILMELETRLSEARRLPLAPGKTELEKDSRGVVYEQEVTVLELQNQRQAQLNGLYQLVIRARWPAGEGNQEREAMVYVYQP